MGFASGYVNKSGYYDGKCANCTYYQLDNVRSAYNDGFKCDKHPLHRTALDDSCPKYRNAHRTDKDIKKAFEKLIQKYGSYRPHKYYIMTAVCNVLTLELTFHKEIGLLYRDEYLENENKDFLEEYDVYGPIIAEKIVEENDMEYAQYLFNTYLINFFTLVLNKKNEEALNLYTRMYNELKQKYLVNEKVRVRTNDNE